MQLADQYGEDWVELLHSSFLATERVRKEKELMQMFGKGEVCKRPRRKIIVGTQVIEQSLDIDFDVMISELAPVDLLIQRLGRLHRHERVRPKGCEMPRLYLLGCSDQLEFDSGSQAVYGGCLLTRTQYFLNDKIRLPEDIFPLVQAVYGKQEIATGVYVGSFNSRVREHLWERVCENLDRGEATLSYASRNEIGYFFETRNTKQAVIETDGIPLVTYRSSFQLTEKGREKYGFSNAYKSHVIHKIQARRGKKSRKIALPGYVIIDLETDGLNETRNHIIEIGAIKVKGGEKEEFHTLIKTGVNLPPFITELTGIRANDLVENGVEIGVALEKFEEFTEGLPLVGYNVEFDLKFLECEYSRTGVSWNRKRYIDILPLVRREKMFLENYKLQTVLLTYGINQEVPHRALEDAKLVQELIGKLNGFEDALIKKA